MSGPEETLPPSSQPQPGIPPSKNRKKWFIENVVSLVFALSIVFMIRSSIVEAFRIPSGSMIPTLLVGDHIFVNKFAYGLKFPFSDLFMDKPLVLLGRDSPKRGDIIVFNYPKDPSIYYIKRVIGTPGDKIEMKNKVLFINDTEIQREDIEGDPRNDLLKDVTDHKYDQANLKLYHEELGAHHATVMIDQARFLSVNYGPIMVSEGNYFVMGDNRDNSNDSRFWGFVPEENIKGKALVIWLSAWFSFENQELNAFRPSRFGKLLQ